MRIIDCSTENLLDNEESISALVRGATADRTCAVLTGFQCMRHQKLCCTSPILLLEEFWRILWAFEMILVGQIAVDSGV